MDRIPTITGLHEMLEKKNYHSLENVFPFLAVFFDRRTENEKKAPMTRVHTRYTKVVANMT